MLLKGPQVIAIQANMLPDPMVEESIGTGAQHIQHKSPKIDHQVGKEQDMSFSHDESPTEPPWVADPMLEEADIASALAQSSTTLNTNGQCMGGQYTDEAGDHTTDPNTMTVTSNQEWNEAESNHQNDDVVASQYKDAVPFVELMAASVPPPILQTPRRAARQVNESEGEDNQPVRRSGRIAKKQTKAGKKNSEELAQEVLAKKLGEVMTEEVAAAQAKDKLLQLFKGPLSKEVMQAMKDLLQAMNIDMQKPIKANGKVVQKKAK